MWDRTGFGYVGFDSSISLNRDRGETEIVLDEIHLLPKFQGHGIGAKIIRELLDEAHTSGKTVALIVLKTNPAKGLYERLGFKIYSETLERFFMRTRA